MPSGLLLRREIAHTDFGGLVGAASVAIELSAMFSGCFTVGVTGRRAIEPDAAAQSAPIAAALNAVMDMIDERRRLCLAESGGPPAEGSIRLHTLLAPGADQIAAANASARGWQVVAPLPFGSQLNIATNALPQTREDALALIAGKVPSDPQVAERAAAIGRWMDEVRLFELAERDDEIGGLLLASLEAPGDADRTVQLGAAVSARAALAAQVMIEQSDLLIGVWDGQRKARVGGTGHTIVTALEMGTPVLLIDPTNPGEWSVLYSIEELAGRHAGADQASERLASVICNVLAARPEAGTTELLNERWHPHSGRLASIYRRIEALFGGEGRPLRSLRQSYELPSAIAEGSAAPLLASARAMPGADLPFVAALAEKILPAFAWADGISTWLSDAYRSGMVANFALSALAVIAGIIYLPFGLTGGKWMFAVAEFLLLASILLITWLGARHRLHARWFETRRAAEYMRHAPIMLLTGVARPAGRWPRGAGTNWPEAAAHRAFRNLGLPQVRVSSGFLIAALRDLLAPHVHNQRIYHEAKAERLAHVHHGLDRMAEWLFGFAVAAVTVYLLLKGASAMGVVPETWATRPSGVFTVLGVALPTTAAAISGIRFFGDFERFAAISEVTAEKLGQIEKRIEQLLSAPESAVDYAAVARLAHEIDDVVVAEIESWQAVFSGKHIALPA